MSRFIDLVTADMETDAERARRLEECNSQEVQPTEEMKQHLKTLRLNPKAIDRIRTFPSPLCVVAVTGTARKGKSTLMNLLLSELGVDLSEGESFPKSAGKDVVTTGIQMYPHAIPITREDGTRLNVMVIDTEGTERGDDNITAKITAVAAFLSSLLVLHVEGGFNNTSLAALSSMLSIIKSNEDQVEQMMSLQGANDAAKVNQVYPTLMVVARSVSEQWLHKSAHMPEDTADEDIGRFLGSEEGQRRLDSILETEFEARSDRSDNLNDTRRHINSWITRRIMQVTVNADRSDLRALNRNPPELLPDGPFADSYRVMLQRMIRNMQPKQVEEVEMSPEAIARMLECFAKAIGTGVFSIPTVLHIMQLAHGEKEVQTLVEKFRAETEHLLSTWDAKSVDESSRLVQELEDFCEENGRASIKELDRYCAEKHYIDDVSKLLEGMLIHEVRLVASACQTRMMSRHKEMARIHMEELERDKERNAIAIREAAAALGRKEEKIEQLLKQAKQDEERRRDLQRQLSQAIQAKSRSGGGCISSSCSVLLPSGESVEARALQVGDVVMGRTGPTDVFFVDHRKHCTEHIVVFGTNDDGSEATIALTPEHLLYANGGLCAAHQICCGDTLTHLRCVTNERGWEERPMIVRHISRKMTTPSMILTLDDSVIVEGIAASCYESSATWGRLESMELRVMYYSNIFRWVLSTDTCKRYVRSVDSVLDPLIATLSGIVSIPW